MSVNASNFPTTVWDGSTPVRSSRNVDAAPGAEDFDQLVAEVLALQKPNGVGVVSGVNVSIGEKAGVLYKTTVNFAALSVNMVDAVAAGCHGSQKVYTFPAGNILVLGAVGEVSLTAGVGGITDTAAVVAALGSAALSAADATLTGTEADVVPSTAATLTGGVGTANMQSTAQLIKDGTTTPGEVHLNIAVPDAGSTGNDTILVTGSVTISWINLGDN